MRADSLSLLWVCRDVWGLALCLRRPPIYTKLKIELKLQKYDIHYRRFSFADVQQPCASSCTRTCKETESIGLFSGGSPCMPPPCYVVKRVLPSAVRVPAHTYLNGVMPWSWRWQAVPRLFPLHFGHGLGAWAPKRCLTHYNLCERWLRHCRFHHFYMTTNILHPHIGRSKAWSSLRKMLWGRWLHELKLVQHGTIVKGGCMSWYQEVTEEVGHKRFTSIRDNYIGFLLAELLLRSGQYCNEWSPETCGYC